MKKILLIVVVVVGMNERNHLATSLSQLDNTNCTEFPDGFEETLQLQVRQIFLFFNKFFMLKMVAVIYINLTFDM